MLTFVLGLLPQRDIAPMKRQCILYHAWGKGKSTLVSLLSDSSADVIRHRGLSLRLMVCKSDCTVPYRSVIQKIPSASLDTACVVTPFPLCKRACVQAQ